MSDAGSPDHAGTGRPMLAVIPVRAGVLPLGADETVAEAGGAALVIGSDCRAAADGLSGIATTILTAEVGPFSPARWAPLVATIVTGHGPADGHVLLPASPDGRDLGPRLAAALDRDLVAGAMSVGPDQAQISRHGGLVAVTLRLDEPIVATLQPGVRGVTRSPEGPPPQVHELEVTAAADGPDPALLAELPPDPSTMDLAEADRIVGGGAGLGSQEAFDRLRDLAAALGASPGGTRVITDWGWLPVERQIGTTGVTVDPALYLAIGISGAVQHTAGLGSPTHIVSVNTDPHCPMMTMADLAIVCDGPAFLDELLAGLGAGPSAEDPRSPQAVGDEVS